MKSYIVRVDTLPALYFGPFAGLEAATEASHALQHRFSTETGTYQMLDNVEVVDTAIAEMAAFNDPDSDWC